MRLFFKNGVRSERAKLVYSWTWTSAVEASGNHLMDRVVNIDCEADYHEGHIELKGSVSLDIDLPCSRCLQSIEHAMVVPVYEIFTRKTSEDDQFEKNMHVIDADYVDLAPYFEENVVLALPYIPLCKPTCKGLCTLCGENLNLHACACKIDQLDPRFAALSKLFKED